ncbi:MAG: glycine cleavage system protein GcvH [Oscillospiraceae bacterium]|jgi:glycine cleavage system H protein|nr:glycine cleavage system protein GcvH [Oscillospiraceae bacterium]MDD7041240.1 glycine cleavage system protein GcvH [Oscillospiraceae bacterium]MDY2611563.1 glycine cleavage system protein GcvH [Oscillospiraceae bacterium]
MNVPKELLYTKSHEWVKKLDDGSVLVGLSDKAQSDLGDLVFVNLPAVGDSFAAEDTLCDVESVKAVSDVYAPVNGTVTEVNEILLDTPEAINKDPYGTWIAKLTDVSGLEDLLDADAYIAVCEEE